MTTGGKSWFIKAQEEDSEEVLTNWVSAIRGAIARYVHTCAGLSLFPKNGPHACAFFHRRLGPRTNQHHTYHHHPTNPPIPHPSAG